MEYKRREVSYEQGNQIKEDNRFEIFMETSAKNGLNVEKLFCDIGKILYNYSMEKNEVSKVRKFFILLFWCRKLILIFIHKLELL